MSTSKRIRTTAAIAAHVRAKYRSKTYPDNRDPETVSKAGKMGSGNCWCGELSGHDWEGKDDGKPHPR
jgi:hypothetical protein